MAKLQFLESPYAKTFYLIQELQKQQYITQSEKSYIKDLLIQKDASVYFILCSKSDLDLKENLQRFIKKLRLKIEHKQFEDDDVSTNKSLKFFLRQKLKLNLKSSNFDLAISKEQNYCIQ